MQVNVKKELIDGVLIYSRDKHPNEIILILSGREGSYINVDEIIIPPFAVHGLNFSEFRPHLLPFDSSIIGLVHSHPLGVLKPSIHDLNHFYGRIMMITAYPYSSIENIAIFDGEGRMLPFRVVSD